MGACGTPSAVFHATVDGALAVHGRDSVHTFRDRRTVRANFHHLTGHYPLKLELMGRRVIGDLMDVFWSGAMALPKDRDPKATSFAGKAAALISPNYRKVFRHSMAQQADLPEQYHRFQLVTDYVCGMTDTFAKRLHAELFNGQ